MGHNMESIAVTASYPPISILTLFHSNMTSICSWYMTILNKNQIFQFFSQLYVAM